MQVCASTTDATRTLHQRLDEEVDAELPNPIRQVLIPVDGTPQSEYMIDWALSNFCKEGDQINLIHVIPQCVPSSCHITCRTLPS